MVHREGNPRDGSKRKKLEKNRTDTKIEDIIFCTRKDMLKEIQNHPRRDKEREKIVLHENQI